MSVTSVSAIAPVSSGLITLNPVASKTAPASETSTAAVSPATASAPASSSASSAALAPRGGGSGGSASAVAEELQSVIYSVTVDGKSYSGTVQEESGGIYQASVPGLPSASGPSLDAAEANLGTIINALA